MNIVPAFVAISSLVPSPWTQESVAKQISVQVENSAGEDFLVVGGLVKMGGNECKANMVKVDFHWTLEEQSVVSVIPTKTSYIESQQICPMHYAPLYQWASVRIPLQQEVENVVIKNYLAPGETKFLPIEEIVTDLGETQNESD